MTHGLNFNKADLEKQVISSVTEYVSEEGLLDFFDEYFVRNKGNFHMLFSKEIGYMTTFVAQVKPSDNLVSFLKVSTFKEDEEQGLISMKDIKAIKFIEGNAVELYINNTYFQLFPYDWGVVKI